MSTHPIDSWRPDPTAVRFQQLKEIPALSSIYPKVAASSVTTKKSKEISQLPNIGYEVTDHRILRDQVDQLNSLFGATGSVGHNSAPSLAVHIAGFPLSTALMARKQFPFGLLGIVHLEHTVWHHQDVPIDQPLRIRTWAQNLQPHRAGVTVEIWVEVYEADQMLWQSCAQYLARGFRIKGVENPDPVEREKFHAPTATATWRLPADIGRQYAKVSGDVNPIHMSSLSARALGMKTMIAHGMYSAGRILAGREPKAPFTWTMSFQTPIFLPGAVDVAFDSSNANNVRVLGWNAERSKPHFEARIVGE